MYSKAGVSMAATALLTVCQYLAVGTADERDPPARVGSGHPPPFRSADGLAFELETLYAEPWRTLWTSLGVLDTVAGRAWRPFIQRYTTAVAPLPAALHTATEARPSRTDINLAMEPGAHYVLVSTRDPDLEDVFLSLTAAEQDAA